MKKGDKVWRWSQGSWGDGKKRGHEATVERVTPSGRVVVDGVQYEPSKWQTGGSVLSERGGRGNIEPLTPEHRAAQNRLHRSIRLLNALDKTPIPNANTLSDRTDAQLDAIEAAINTLKTELSE